MDFNKLCTHCMRESDTQKGQPCPHCGHPYQPDVELQHQLRPFTVLKGKYLVGDVLGEGGFGITYIGLDMELEFRVAIKEFYPNGYASRESANTTELTIYAGQNEQTVMKWRDNFLKEARSLAKVANLSGVVGVREFFQENNTAYIIMDYLEGQTLKDYARTTGGRIPASFLLPAMEPVILSLAEVHKQGLIHRDISPDNIMMAPDGSMKLLDFGAARDFTAEGEKSLSVMLKPGYAPEEQYRRKGDQGPWSDVYAMAGTIYKCLTGTTPPESMERLRNDTLVPPNQLGAGLSPAQEQALLKGLAVFAENRYRSMGEFHRDLYQAATISPVPDSRTVSLQGVEKTVAFVQDANAAGPFTQGPNTGVPFTQGPNTGAPFTQGPNTGAPFAQGPNTTAQFTQGPYTQAPPMPQPKKSSAALWIVLGVVGVVVIGIGVGGFLFYQNIRRQTTEALTAAEEAVLDFGAEMEEAAEEWEDVQPEESEGGSLAEEAAEPSSSGSYSSWGGRDQFEGLMMDAAAMEQSGDFGEARDALADAAQLAADAGLLEAVQDDVKSGYQSYTESVKNYINNSLLIQQFNATIFLEIRNQVEKADKLADKLKEMGYTLRKDEDLEELSIKQGRDKMISMFDNEARASVYSRTTVWELMKGLGDDEGNYLGGSADLDDPLRRRYAYAYAGHLHSELEKGNTDQMYVIAHLENTDYNPILLKLLSDKGDSSASELVGYFVNDIMRGNQHASDFTNARLDRFGDYWYFNNPNELDQENCCTPANREDFINMGRGEYR